MVFNIGDRVRFKNDATNQRWSVVDIYPANGKVQICAKDLGVYRVVEPSLLVEVDPVSEIKQAIREVLLSDEFLKAFAAAWVKTPILHESEIKLDLICDPITGTESEAYYLDKLKKGEAK